MSATALAFARSDAPSVADVVAIAGTGRNTFYEFFDDVAHARKAVEKSAIRFVEGALRAAEASTRTPVERFRALVRAWVECAFASPAELLLVLRSCGESGLSAIGTALAGALARAVETLRAAGVAAPAHEPLRAHAVAAAAEMVARSIARGILEGHETGAPERARVERVLVDVAVRLLR